LCAQRVPHARMGPGCPLHALRAVRLLAGLREHVLNGDRLRPPQLAVMAQLNMWTRCCELSVAQSVDACCKPGLAEDMLARALGKRGEGKAAAAAAGAKAASAGGK
jgi:hypothetical protein